MRKQPTKPVLLTVLATTIILVAATVFGGMPAQGSTGASMSSSPGQPGTLTPRVYLPIMQRSCPIPQLASSSSGAYRPMAENQPPHLLPIIPPSTKVLDSTTVQALSSVSPDQSVITFTQTTPQLTALAPGQVIVLGVSASTPDGLLRKVTSVSEFDGRVVVHSTAATLEEAIQTGSISLSQSLTPDDVRSMHLSQGVSLNSAPLAAQQGHFYLELKDVDLGQGVTANGSIELTPSFNFDLLIQNWQLETLCFTTAQRETADLRFSTRSAIPILNVKKTLLTFRFAPLAVMVGVVPIVITPTLEVYVGANGSVQAGVTTGVKQEATLIAGAQYANGSWIAISHPSNQFSYSPPKLSAGMSLKGYAESVLTLLTAGVVGANMDATLYLELNADLLRTPWWQLYGGLQVDVGVEVVVLSQVVAGWHARLIDYRILLAEATGPPPEPAWSPAASLRLWSVLEAAHPLPSRKSPAA